MGKARRSEVQSRDDDLALSDVEAALAGRISVEQPVFRPEESPAFEEAVQSLNRIEKRHRLSRANRVLLREALTFELARRAFDMPETAPELWSERRGTKENPVMFIRRVYAPWLGRGLRRSHFHSLDRALYSALGVWLHRHPDIGFPELDD
jgi:hypothetical protein